MTVLRWLLPLLCLTSCEHDEHPFEVTWQMSCTAEGAPADMVGVFNPDFWEDDRGNRREYIGEVRIMVDADLWDAYLWEVGVNLRDERAETLSLERVPMPDSFIEAYDLKPLDLQLVNYSEDPEGQFANMSGTCAWGDETGRLDMSMRDDCDACLDCSVVGPVVPAAVLLVPVLLGLRRRRLDA